MRKTLSEGDTTSTHSLSSSFLLMLPKTQWQFLCYNFHCYFSISLSNTLVCFFLCHIKIHIVEEKVYKDESQGARRLFPYFLILKRFLLAVKEIFSVVFSSSCSTTILSLSFYFFFSAPASGPWCCYCYFYYAILWSVCCMCVSAWRGGWQLFCSRGGFEGDGEKFIKARRKDREKENKNEASWIRFWRIWKTLLSPIWAKFLSSFWSFSGSSFLVVAFSVFLFSRKIENLWSIHDKPFGDRLIDFNCYSLSVFCRRPIARYHRWNPHRFNSESIRNSTSSLTFFLNFSLSRCSSSLSLINFSYYANSIHDTRRRGCRYRSRKNKKDIFHDNFMHTQCCWLLSLRQKKMKNRGEQKNH